MNEFKEKRKSTIESHNPPFESGDDPSMRELLVTMFRGKMRKWTFLVYAYIALFVAVAVAAGVWFFDKLIDTLAREGEEA